MNFIPYLVFDGKAEEALHFYREAFGGVSSIGVEESKITRFGEVPNPSIPATMNNHVLHAELKVGGLLIYFSDSYRPVAKGDNVTLLLNCDSQKQVDEYFAALSVGGKVDLSPQRTFWNAYYANLTDKYGVCWQLNYNLG